MKFTPFGPSEIPPVDFDAARVVVLPLCYEQEPSFGSGSKDGAIHILDASVELETIDEETLSDWTAIGIHTAQPIFADEGPEDALERMKQAADACISEDKRLIVLGGDHAVTIASVGAAAERYPRMGVLQIDAHPDLRYKWNGSRFNHACVMRRVIQDMGLAAVQVGLRTICAEELEFMEENRLFPFYAHHIDPGDDSWIQDVVGCLPKDVYITVDLDGLDPSVMPGTGTPVPGGLSYRQLIALIQAVGDQKRVVAADVVELVKLPNSSVSEFTAAKIVQKIIAKCWMGR